MRRFATGVTVVTLADQGEQAAITVSAFTSISLDPAIVMVSIHGAGSASEVLNRTEGIGIHLLGKSDALLSDRCASSGSWDEKLSGFSWRRGHTGVPLIDGPATVIEARVMQKLTVGTHIVTFGEVEQIYFNGTPPEEPLLYFDQSYRTISSNKES